MDWNPQKARFGWKPQQVGSSPTAKIQGPELVCPEKWHFNRASTGGCTTSVLLAPLFPGAGAAASQAGWKLRGWQGAEVGHGWRGVFSQAGCCVYGLRAQGPGEWAQGLAEGVRAVLCGGINSVPLGTCGAAALRPDSINVFCPCPLGFQ